MPQADSTTKSLKYKPFISIIITVLNGEETLEECLNSIYEQTYSNYELVIVDGGSTDHTIDIINTSPIANKVVNILPGSGLYAGLNAGVSLSTGEWLYFLGADDKLHNFDTLQKVSGMIKHKKETTKVLVGNVNCVKQKNILRPKFGSPYLLRHSVHHQGMFYHKSVFAKLSYNESMRIASDYEFNLRLAIIGIPHQSMDIIVCDFAGDGISENQLNRGYSEMQQAHERLFNGFDFLWVKKYFWLRRKTGALLRHYNLLKFRMWLKNIFG
ncbi:glycosyltransferase [Spirosoma koreense]